VFPFLKAGATLAVFQSLGKIPVDKDELKMSVSTGASSLAVSLRTRQGISSGPDALLGFTLHNSFSTPRVSTVMFGIAGNLSPTGDGIEVVSSLVKTEENWLLRIFALD
jgi:hypothetical protein